MIHLYLSLGAAFERRTRRRGIGISYVGGGEGRRGGGLS